MRRYTVVLTAAPDGTAWHLVVSALPGCLTWGATIEEALAMARDAITTYLDSEPADEWPVPGETVVAEIDVPIVADGALLRTKASVASNAA